MMICGPCAPTAAEGSSPAAPFLQLPVQYTPVLLLGSTQSLQLSEFQMLKNAFLKIAVLE